MNIKPWQERVKTEYHGLNLARDFMQAEIDELRSALQERDAYAKAAIAMALAHKVERDALVAELGQPVPLSEWQQLVAERDALLEDKKSNTVAFLAMRESRDALKDRRRHSEAWEPDAKRLALELECLLMSCDLPAASKWWDSAHEAMELHRQLIADIYKDIEAKS